MLVLDSFFMNTADEMCQSSLITGRKSMLVCFQEKLISNIVLSLFIWEAPPHWDSTWNSARDDFNNRAKCSAAATKIQPIHKPWKTALHIHSSNIDMTLATKLSSFLPLCGDRWQSRTVLRNLIVTRRLRKAACQSRAWVCKPCKERCVGVPVWWQIPI